jgi:hypothetical protein
MSENGAASHDVVAEARAFLGQRNEYRDKLESELLAAEARVAEIRSLLADLGGSTQAQSRLPFSPPKTFKIPKVNKPFSDPKSATVAQVISVVVERSPGLGSGQIVKSVVALKSNAKGPTVFPTLYRMRDIGRLVEVDKKYYLPEKAPSGASE